MYSVTQLYRLHQINLFFFAGSTKIGILRSCLTLRNRPTECFMQDLSTEWIVALICIFCGCICLTTTLGLIIVTQWERSLEQYARWSGFLAGN